MDKKKYFFVLYILAFGYLQNSFTSSVITIDVSFVLTMLWGGWGWIMYSGKKKNQYLPGINSIAIAITACLLISPLVPFFCYGQPYLGTLISQRFNYAIFLLPVIARIRPTEEDLFKPMQLCSYITIVFFVLSIFIPSLFVGQETLGEIQNAREKSNSTDVGMIVAGIPLSIFYLYYKLTVSCKKYTKKDILECVALLTMLIAIQNRSTLLGLAPIVLYAFYKLVKVGKGKAAFIIIAVVLIAAPVLLLLWNNLAQETEEQLGNESYPRLLAIHYFVFEAKDNLIKVLFGNGIWTGSSMYAKLIYSWPDNIFVSDIGLLGTYFYYGILPLVIVYRYVIFTLFKSKMPVFIRYYSLWILLVPTIHCFLILSVPNNLLFVIYFYLVLYYKKSISSPNRIRLCETRT